MTTYPISKIRSGEVAVRIENYEQYKRLCDAVGDEYNDIGYYDIKKEYYGTEHNDNTVIFMEDSDLSTRTKIDFQQIDWEEGKEETVKEEINPYPFYAYASGHYSNACKVCNEEFIGDKLARMCLECSIITAKKELSTLKAENERLSKENERLVKFNNELSNLMHKQILDNIKLQQPSQPQELSLKQRMAWEIANKTELTTGIIANAYKRVEFFLNYKGGDDEKV